MNLKSKLTITSIIDVLPLSRTTIIKFKRIIDFDMLCTVLLSDNYTTREKRNYLYSLENIDEQNKEMFWNAFTGDNLNDYANIPDIDYSDTLEGDESDE
jgi:hypothetical protein